VRVEGEGHPLAIGACLTAAEADALQEALSAHLGLKSA
jgi:hypothetical protein